MRVPGWVQGLADLAIMLVLVGGVILLLI